MKTLLSLCMMTLLTIKRIQGLESSSTVLVVRMSTTEFQRFQSELPCPTLVETELPLFFYADFPWNRIMLEKMLPSTIFLPFFLGTKQQLKEAAEKLWTAVQMIIYSYTTLIMVVLGCLVSNWIATSSICIHHLIYWVLYFVESFWTWQVFMIWLGKKCSFIHSSF